MRPILFQALLAGSLAINAFPAWACTALPAPTYVIDNMSGCQGSRFDRIELPVPASWASTCVLVDGNGETVLDRSEAALAAGSEGVFADLTLEAQAVVAGGSGYVSSQTWVGVERVNDLVAWVDVPVRYVYQIEASADGIGPNTNGARMQASIGGFIPNVSVDACALIPRRGFEHCDSSGTQFDSASGSGLVLIGQNGRVSFQAQAFGTVRSSSPTGDGSLGPSVGGQATASLTVEIDPNFAFASAFRLIFSDGDCIFGGDDDGGFE